LIKINPYYFKILSSDTLMMTWLDSLDIAISLDESHPEINPKTVNFVDLQNLVLGLDEFDAGETQCGERVLEAIQMHWIEEKE